MIIQIVAKNLVTERLLIAEVERQKMPVQINKFAQYCLDVWHSDKPSHRVYQLESVQVLKQH